MICWLGWHRLGLMLAYRTRSGTPVYRACCRRCGKWYGRY